MSREEILARWRRKRADGKPLGGGSEGDYRVVPGGAASARALLPFSDANGELLRAIPGAVKGPIPVVAAVCGTDPTRPMGQLLRELVSMGCAGVQNAPSVGLIDGAFRTSLEETQLGYAREVEMIRAARELGLITAPLVFSEQDASAMGEAGADLLVAAVGSDMESISQVAGTTMLLALVSAPEEAAALRRRVKRLDGVQVK